MLNPFAPVKGLVCVSLDVGGSGDKGGEVLQSGESGGRQTLGSLTWRTSNGGRVLRISKLTGISLQARVVSTAVLGEDSPLEL